MKPQSGLNKQARKQYPTEWWQGRNAGLRYVIEHGTTELPFWPLRTLAIELWPSPESATLFGQSHAMYLWR